MTELTAGEISALKERIGDRRIVASISGGKDSAAMSLHLMELGIDHDRVFMDTGWEHPETYEYLRGPLTEKLGPITEIGRSGGMVQLIRDKQMFPHRMVRFCTTELKVFPFQAYIKALGQECLNTVGIRAAESEARSKMAEWEWSDGFDCEVWRPLLSWGFDDVVAIHKRHGLRPNPLYVLGAERVGCWPCVFARKDEIRMVADFDPQRIAAIAALELEQTNLALARYAERGETMPSSRSFFNRPAYKDNDGNTPIAAAVEWSRTSHGGKQFELFHDPSNAGCMRWGLCDTGNE